MNYFASNIKFLRNRKGLQQAEICILIGFKQSTWSGYENDFSKPNFKDLLKIIEFFEVSASGLLEIDLSNVNLNENGQNQPCQECIVKDNFIAVKDQLLQNKKELIESLYVQIKLLKNQIEQMKYETHEKQQTQRKDRKSA